MKKIGPALLEWLATHHEAKGSRPIRVVVQVANFHIPEKGRGLSRTEHAELSKNAFDQAARPVRHLLEKHGAKVEESGAWLSGFLCANLPSDELHAVVDSKLVASVDLVANVRRESVAR